MARISAERWFKGSVDEAVAAKLGEAVDVLTPVSLMPTIALFQAALNAGFAEPLIAHGPRFITKVAGFMEQNPKQAVKMGRAVGPLMASIATLEESRLAFVKELLY